MAAPNKGFIAGALAGVGVAATAAAGVGLALPQAFAQDAQPRAIRAATAPIFAPPPGGPQSFADIFERVAPAVVSITVTSRVSRAEMNQQQLPFPFNQLPQFRQGPQGRGGGGAPPTGPGLGSRRGPDGRPLAPNGDTDGDGDADLPEAQAAGSGFFVSADGYVVTNNHVIENATRILVTLTDKRELVARVVGRDEESDLAVLKVDAPGRYPFVNFEREAKPRVGDWVLAVGNPLQLGGTATAGIVSAIGRDLPNDGGPSTLPAEYLQVDAPINRGNSGGPTFDTFGRVIGVNTAIYSSTGGSIGIGFAVPADTADAIVKDLIAGRKISRGYLGASITNVTTDAAEALGIEARSGALISSVTPSGPGQRAGLQAGDIILSINGRKVYGSSELTRAVAGTRAGDVMRLEVRRGGRMQTINVTAGVRPSIAQLNNTGSTEDTPTGPTPGRPEVAPATVLGLGVRPLDEAGRSANALPPEVRGLLIESAVPGSDAARKGLRRGMVIVQANERVVSTVAELNAAIADARRAGRPSVFLLIYSSGGTAGVPVKLDAPATAAPAPTR